MAVTNPVRFSGELKYASTAKTAPSDDALFRITHDQESSALAIDTGVVHRSGWKAGSIGVRGLRERRARREQAVT